MRGYTKGTASLDPLNVYKGHTSIVEDVAWHNLNEDVFASVGDDRMLLLSVCGAPGPSFCSFGPELGPIVAVLECFRVPV